MDCVAIDHITLPSTVMRDLQSSLDSAEVQLLQAHPTASQQEKCWPFAFGSALTWTHPDRDEVYESEILRAYATRPDKHFSSVACTLPSAALSRTAVRERITLRWLR